MKKAKRLSYIIIGLLFFLCCYACTLRRADSDVNDMHILRRIIEGSPSYDNLYVTRLVITDLSAASDMRSKKWVLSGYLDSRVEFRMLCNELTKHQLFQKVALNVDIQVPLEDKGELSQHSTNELTETSALERGAAAGSK